MPEPESKSYEYVLIPKNAPSSNLSVFHMIPISRAVIPIKMKRLRPSAKPPVRSTEGAACFDVFAAERQTIYPKDDEFHADYNLIPTGWAFEVPPGYRMNIVPRSGLSKNLMICNAPATLDSDYRGELLVLIRGMSHQYYTIEIGDRIAQIEINRVLPIEFIEEENLSTTERGEGGFGSTGR